MDILEILLWVIGVLVVLGVIVGLLAFVGLRKLWRFVDDRFTEDGRPGPGRPPMSRRSAGPAGSRPRRPTEPKDTTAVRDVRR